MLERSIIKNLVSKKISLLCVASLLTCMGISAGIGQIETKAATENATYEQIYKESVRKSDLEQQNQEMFFNLVAHDNMDVQVTRDGTFLKAYCTTYGMNALKIAQQEKVFKERINQMNETFKSIDSNTKGIAYEPYAGTSKNLFMKTEGSVTKTNNLEDANIPYQLSAKGNADYQKTVDLSKYFSAADCGNKTMSLSLNVASLPMGRVSVQFFDAKHNLLGSGECTKSGKLSIENVDVTKVFEGENKAVTMELSIKGTNNSYVLINNLSWVPESDGASQLEKIYLTSQPVPQDVKEDYISKNGNPDNKATYLKDEDMYVVMQFTGPVLLNKKIYYDFDLIKYINSFESHATETVYAKEYPRLALSLNQGGDVEQNDNTAIYADYFGTMDGGNASANCLIFKVDLSGWEEQNFTITGLSRQTNRVNRTGNMEWLYADDLRSTNLYETTLKSLFPYAYSHLYQTSNGKINKEYVNTFRGAITDKKGNRISVNPSTMVSEITINAGNSNETKALAVHAGANPVIESVTIQDASVENNRYLHKGDKVKVSVAYSTLLDDTVPVPKMYLNDYAYKETAQPGKEGWTGTVLSNGKYETNDLVPLNAALKVDKNDAENGFLLSANEDASKVSNKRGSATLEITGIAAANADEDMKVYYRVVDQSSVELQVGDTFNKEGWTEYTNGPVKLTKLPTVLYQKSELASEGTNTQYSMKKVSEGGFIDICQVVKQEMKETDTESGAGKISENWLVVKYGESDEIDTSEDSENAMQQRNTSVKSVITYVETLNAEVDLYNLRVLPKVSGGDYSYGSRYEDTYKTLLVDGEVKDTNGFVMGSENNFVLRDDSGKIVSPGTQYSYVGIDNEAPTLSMLLYNQELSLVGGKEAGYDVCFSDTLSGAARLDLYHKTGSLGIISGLKSLSFKVGPVNADLEVAIGDKTQTVSKGKTETIDYPLTTAVEQAGKLNCKIKLLPNDAGTYNHVVVPFVVNAKDFAGNISSVQNNINLGLNYSEFNLISSRTEAVACDFIQDADKEKAGSFTVVAECQDASASFNESAYKVCILDKGQEPDENTIWYSCPFSEESTSFGKTEIPYDAEDVSGNSVPQKAMLYVGGKSKAENLSDSADSSDSSNETYICRNLVLTGNYACRGVKADKTVYVTYQTQDGNQYSYEQNNGESKKTVTKKWKSYDLSFDTTEVSAPLDRSDYKDYVIWGPLQTPSVSENSVSISMVDGQTVNGKLKRKDSYQFLVKTDENTTVEIYCRGIFNGASEIYAQKPYRIEPNSNRVIDTKEDLKMTYNGTVTDGTAWLYYYNVEFSAISTKYREKTTYHYNVESKQWEQTTEKVELPYDKIYNNRASKYYSLNVFDENFMHRTTETCAQGSNNQFGNDNYFEMNAKWNSINGYYYIKESDTRYIPSSSGLYDDLTLTFSNGSSEYLNPETDIDFENSYIDIYEIKPSAPDEYGCYDQNLYDKVGEPVRRIPLPANMHTVNYYASHVEGQGPQKSALGFTFDANAYQTQEIIAEDGSTQEQLVMPKEGTYGVYVNIQTYCKDKNGKPVTITSDAWDYDGYTHIEEYPSAVFKYDYEAPDSRLYFGSEVVNYMLAHPDALELSHSYDNYYTVENFSNADLFEKQSSSNYAIVKPGEKISFYVGCTNKDLMENSYCTNVSDGKDTYTIGTYAASEQSDASPSWCTNYGQFKDGMKVEYALVPSDTLDAYGNVLKDKMEGVNWEIAYSQYATGVNSFETAYPEDGKGAYYVLVKMTDAAGNESALMKKKLIPDVTAPTAKLYQYVSQNGKTVQLIQLADDYSKNSEIFVTKEEINGVVTEHAYGEVSAADYVKVITEDALKVTIMDKVGNERTLDLNSAETLKAPTLYAQSSNPVGKINADITNLNTYINAVEDSIRKGEKTLDELEFNTKNPESGNGYLEFLVKPEMGDDIYVDYAFSPNSYNTLFTLEGEEAEQNLLWNSVGNGTQLHTYGMVNAVYSDKPDADGYYKVKALVCLPKDQNADYILNFRFRNGSGTAIYYTAGWKVTKAGDITAMADEIVEGYEGNMTHVLFNQPVKVISPVLGKASTSFVTETDMYCDANGTYGLKVEDLKGNQKDILLDYNLKPDYAPDFEKSVSTKADGTSEILLDMDMGYEKGWLMTFDDEQLSGKGYTILLPDEEEGRTVSVNGIYGYQYAQAEITDNTEFAIPLTKEDGSETASYIYHEGSFVETEDKSSVTYSRTMATTSADNQAEPVDAILTLPESAQVLSVGGCAHTFYKNGSFTFTVKYADGIIKDIKAQVNCITANAVNENDDIKPLYSMTRYFRNEGELIDVTSTPESEMPQTNADVLVKVWPMDIDPDSHALNPVDMTITSKNGKVKQDKDDEYMLVFTGNDTAHVTLKDPNGNAQTFDVEVKNINKQKKLTANIRYVRYGLTQMRAYIDLPEGVKLAKLDGIQSEKRSDGTYEYYHLFTQSGDFEFKLAGDNGNTASVWTKEIYVVREPLVLSLTSKSPETPDWGEKQVMTVLANLKLESTYVTKPSSDTELSQEELDHMGIDIKSESKRIMVSFSDNKTVVLHAKAENGSAAEITLAQNSIKEDTMAPTLQLTVMGNEYDSERRVNVTLLDSINKKYETENDNIAVHVEGKISDYSEKLDVSTQNNVKNLTKKVQFMAKESGIYTIYAYDMGGNMVSREVQINMDNEPPVITIEKEPDIKSEKSKTIQVRLNEPGTITCQGKTYPVKSEDDIISIPVTQNGICTLIAKDRGLNEAQTEVEIAGIDNTPPVLKVNGSKTLSYWIKDFKSEDKEKELSDKILENVIVSDDSDEQINCEVKYDKALDFNTEKTYIATVVAKDACNNQAKQIFTVKLSKNETTSHPELDTVSVNGKEMVENTIISVNGTNLLFEGLPENAEIFWAYGKYTGAQMKYHSSKLDGVSMAADQGTYTIMVRLNDYTIHLYYIIVSAF